jgi:hypothetical protein
MRIYVPESNALTVDIPDDDLAGDDYVRAENLGLSVHEVRSRYPQAVEYGPAHDPYWSAEQIADLEASRANAAEEYDEQHGRWPWSVDLAAIPQGTTKGVRQ